MEPDKIEVVHTIQSKLEDVQRSQVALVQKLAQLQLDLINMPDKDLENGLDDLYSNASSNADAIESLLEKYTMKVNIIDQEDSKTRNQTEGA